MSKNIPFSLNLSYDQFISVYTGDAKYVVTRAFDGRNIKFPANILKPYLTRKGIQGNFIIYFDHQHKFKSLEKLK